MKTNLYIYAAPLVALVAAGCASPHVVDIKQTGDKSMSCQDIENAVDEADRFERNARGDRKVTGTNVAAVLFFWPGLLATYANTGDAIEAAKERKAYLAKLAEQKGC
jgi:hypothetical protein